MPPTGNTSLYTPYRHYAPLQSRFYGSLIPNYIRIQNCSSTGEASSIYDKNNIQWLTIIISSINSSIWSFAFNLSVGNHVAKGTYIVNSKAAAAAAAA